MMKYALILLLLTITSPSLVYCGGGLSRLNQDKPAQNQSNHHEPIQKELISHLENLKLETFTSRQAFQDQLNKEMRDSTKFPLLHAFIASGTFKANKNAEQELRKALCKTTFDFLQRKKFFNEDENSIQ